MGKRNLCLACLSGLILFTGLMRIGIAAEPPVGNVPKERDKLTVLVVGEGNLFLSKALEAGGASSVRTIKPADYEPAKAAVFDVIVFDRFAPAGLPEKGGLLFIDALPPGGGLKQAADEQGKPLIVESAIKDWKKDHPAMKDFAPIKIYIESARKLEMTKDWTVLLDGDKAPLIAASDANQRRQIVLAFDVMKSNWPMKVSFPIFVSNATAYLAGR